MHDPLTRPRTVVFHTFGCRLNQAETSTLQQQFEDRGYHVAAHGDPADLAVINTCTVTENGDAETRRLVNRIQRRSPGTAIALIGCHAQMQSEALAAMPGVNWVVGNGAKMELPDLIAANPAGDKAHIDIREISAEPFRVHTSRGSRDRTRANLKIQDGCDFFCFFCVIPYARGRARSRIAEDVLEEAQALARSGHRELVITGVNIGTYSNGRYGFLELMAELEKVDGLERLRISSIEPTTIPTALLDRMHPGSVLCRHLHIPIQSGHDDVLFRMNRRYTVAQYSEFALEAHRRVEGLCLGTDVIVGYPGETAEMFEGTVECLRDLPFAYFHVFSYSERPEAKSAIFPDPVDRSVIAERSRILRGLSARKLQRFQQSFVGRTMEVLFEERRDGWWRGTTDNYLRVRVRDDRDLGNQILPVSLDTRCENWLSGSVRPTS